MPCPRMTRGSSNGCTNVAPVSATCANAPVRVWAPSDRRGRPVAPKPSMSARLAAATLSGTCTVASMPSICAAQATAAPWLPEETATTPLWSIGGRDVRQAVERATELERAGALLRLVLAEHRRPGQCVEPVGAQHGRDHCFGTRSSGRRRGCRRAGSSSSPAGQDTESGLRRGPVECPALLAEPFLQGVGAEVLLDDQRCLARRRSGDPARSQQFVERRLADPDRRVRPDRREASPRRGLRRDGRHECSECRCVRHFARRGRAPARSRRPPRRWRRGNGGPSSMRWGRRRSPGRAGCPPAAIGMLGPEQERCRRVEVAVGEHATVGLHRERACRAT